MSDRSRRICQLALKMKELESDSDDYSNDPYLDDSFDDPAFSPSSSIDSDASESDHDIAGPSGHCASKRPRLDSYESLDREIQDPDLHTVDLSQPVLIPGNLASGSQQHHERKYQHDDDNEAETEPAEFDDDEPIFLRDLSTSVWGPPIGNHLVFDETFAGGIKPEWHAALQGCKPEEYYTAFVNNHILDEIADQTNLYATQFVLENKNISNQARMQSWEPTSRKEIANFLGLLGYMGIVRMTCIRDYWSTKWLCKNEVAGKIMSRNRFELLLKMLHFSDNSKCPEGDRLYKVQPLLDKVLENYQAIYTPGKTFCIDESMIPFQGRLLFKQYNPQKGHKYGIKVFKLCSEQGYTWNLSIYAGKEKNDGLVAVSTSIVLKLAKDLLGCGRVCVTDNWYTSLQLAHILLDNKTHFLGTLRSNRKGNPVDVITKKLKKGEVITQEDDRGICVLKWRDKRDVLVLSTYHHDEMVELQRRGQPVEKPKAIVDYNSGKSSIDLSDQMSSYSTALRRSIRWYKKVAIEILLGTSVVNAHFIFKEVEQSAMSISDFRYAVIEGLLKFEDNRVCEDIPKPKISLRAHVFTKLDCKARENRKYCKGCYKKKQEGQIEKNKVKKVITYCDQCEGNPRFCLECFNSFHKGR